MRFTIPLLLLVSILILGCNGSGIKLIVGDISGPDSVYQGDSVQLSITAGGDSGIVYIWAVDPYTSGTFNDTGSPNPIFTASLSDTESLDAVISVVVASDKSDPVLRSHDIVIKKEPSPPVKEKPVALAQASSVQAQVFQEITFFDAGSYDPDGGDIVKYEWDWNGSLDYTGEGVVVTHLWATPGIYEVRLRVTDDEGETDVIDAPLIIEVTPIPPIENIGWVRQIGSVGNDDVTGIGVFNDGTTVVCGYTTAYYNQNGSGFATNFLLAAFDPDGNLKWLKDWGTPDNNEYWDALVLGENGRIYVAGRFQQELDIDPGPEVTMIHSDDGQFLAASFDNEGNLIWFIQWSCSSPAYAITGIKVNNSGEVAIAGFYSGTMVFDPLNDSLSITAMGYSSDIFFARTDANGQFLESASIGGTSVDVCNGIDSDNDGNIYISGYTMGQLDYDPGSGEVFRELIGAYDSFVASYGPNFELRWANQWGSVSNDSARSITVNNGDGVYVLGLYEDNMDADPGPGVLEVTGNSYYSLYLSKFETDGDFLWVKSLLGDSSIYTDSVSSGSDGSVYFSGFSWSPLDLDPGPGIDMHGNPYAYFMVRLSPSGDYVWGRSHYKYNYGQISNMIFSNGPDSYIRAAGVFTGAIDLNFGPNQDIRTSTGGTDIFVAKYNIEGYPE